LQSGDEDAWGDPKSETVRKFPVNCPFKFGAILVLFVTLRFSISWIESCELPVPNAKLRNLGINRGFSPEKQKTPCYFPCYRQIESFPAVNLRLRGA
jgi:hypothetical protein